MLTDFFVLARRKLVCYPVSRWSDGVLIRALRSSRGNFFILNKKGIKNNDDEQI